MPVNAIRKITRRLRRVPDSGAWNSLPARSAPANPEPSNPRAAISGRLCMRSALDLHSRLFGLFQRRGKCRAVALDVSRVRFLDGSALAVLIEFAQACRTRGVTLTLIQPSAQVWNTFALYGLEDALVQLADFRQIDVDGVLIVLDEEFPDSIRMPKAA
jgi:anti-anti-sigma factor